MALATRVELSRAVRAATSTLQVLGNAQNVFALAAQHSPLVTP